MFFESAERLNPAAVFSQYLKPRVPVDILRTLLAGVVVRAELLKLVLNVQSGLACSMCVPVSEQSFSGITVLLFLIFRKQD